MNRRPVRGFLPAVHAFEHKLADDLVGAMKRNSTTRQFFRKIGRDHPTFVGGSGGIAGFSTTDSATALAMAREPEV